MAAANTCETGEWHQFFDHTTAPDDYEPISRRIADWVVKHSHVGCKIALVTSGGTTVPLERNTVRFVDNFSIGTRGAASSEYFLQHGYAVIFLHRDSSAQPFVRHLRPQTLLDAFLGDEEVTTAASERAEDAGAPHERIQITLDVATSNKLRPVLQLYRTVVRQERLLSLPFTSLSSYLWLLRNVTQALQQHHSSKPALLYLAAAVADFYIPYEELSEHKLQSSSGPLTVQLQLVPKMLAPLVAHWGPNLYVVSFKLETDSTKLIDKSQAALQRYRHHLVVGNLLQTRRDQVILVEPASNATECGAPSIKYSGGTTNCSSTSTEPTDTSKECSSTSTKCNDDNTQAESNKEGSVSCSSTEETSTHCKESRSVEDGVLEQVKIKVLKLSGEQKLLKFEIEEIIVREVCSRHQLFLSKLSLGDELK
uniref:Phosphopantothenate--cysteine ligase n=1 Tax=Hirondellea gigas TaxID=1518452 RepID=A0A6A7FZ20_9CRUS